MLNSLLYFEYMNIKGKNLFRQDMIVFSKIFIVKLVSILGFDLHDKKIN